MISIPRLKLAGGLIALLTGLALVGAAAAAEFSADMIRTMAGHTTEGKVYIKDKKMRIEGGPGEPITIVDGEAAKIYVIMPQAGMYLEHPAEGPMGQMLEEPSPEADAKMGVKRVKLGTETVNGYKCDKIKVVFDDPSQGEMIQWVSKKHKLPIKMVHNGPMGRIVIEYKNIKTSGLRDSLFKPPKGLRKMQMPKMGGQMGGGMSMPNIPGMTPPSD